MTNLMINNVSVYNRKSVEVLRAHIVYYHLFITLQPQDIFCFCMYGYIQHLFSMNYCSLITMSSCLHCIAGKLLMYCGKKQNNKKTNVVCDMFCKHWMGDAMQMIFYLCHKLYCLETRFCICDKPQICTCNLGNERALLHVLIMVFDENKARAKTILIFYTVFQVCVFFFLIFCDHAHAFMNKMW